MDIEKRGLWNEGDLKTELTKVITSKMSLTDASTQYNIPKSTLSDKITPLKSGKEIILKPKLGAFTKTFPLEYENQLSESYKLLVEEKENDERVKEQKKNLRSNFRKSNRAKKIKKTRAEKPENINKKTVIVVYLETNDEDWIHCQEWAHEASADIPECSDDYICDHCNLF